jgi:hypothetical protein
MRIWHGYVLRDKNRANWHALACFLARLALFWHGTKSDCLHAHAVGVLQDDGFHQILLKEPGRIDIAFGAGSTGAGGRLKKDID